MDNDNDEGEHDMTYAIETTECFRCFGTGRYGPSSIFAGRCFHCSGSGKVLTRSGAKVKVDYDALCRRTFAEIVPGTRVWDEGINAGSFVVPAKVWTVDAVEANDGEYKLVGASMSVGGYASSTIRLALTRDEKQAILASLAPRAGLLLDGEPTKVTKSRKSDAEKAATKAAARERTAAKREAARHANPATEKQLALIASYGIEPLRTVSTVEASQLIDRLFSRAS